MEIVTANTNGMPLHQWAEGLTLVQLVNTDWLTDLVNKVPIDELLPHNPALGAIIEAKNNQAGNRGSSDFDHILQKEKVMALIHKSKKNHPSS